METNKVHLNDPQLEILMVAAAITLAFMGRATGKTHGAGGPFTAKNVADMPRGNHFIASSSYEKVLNDILPKLQKGWEDLGYRENIHYWVRKWAPEKLRIPKPYLPPNSPHYLVHWANGACNRLVSVDRPKLFVGTDGDSLYADEVRLFNPDVFAQLLLNIRGNTDKFGHLPNHHSVLMTTDLPRDIKGEWLFDFEKEMDEQKIKAIIQAQQLIFELREQYDRARTKKAKMQIQSTINELEAGCNELRKDLVFVKYASSLENVEVLGIETLEKWKKTMSAESFTVSVLTERLKNYGKYFYSMFNQDDHTYNSSNYEIIDQLDQEGYRNAPWSMTQKDLLKDKPLELSGDFNAAIIWLVIGQKLPGRLNGIGSIWLKKPKKVKDLAKLFDHHFKEKKRYNRQVIFHYDQTAKGTNAMNDSTYLKEWVKQLSDLGWQVRQNFVGSAPTHRARHKLWESMCDHNDPATSNFYMNKNTNADSIKSIEDAKVRRSGDDFKKDKRSEYSETINAEHATHASEAWDILLWGCEVDPYRSSPGFINTLTGL